MGDPRGAVAGAPRKLARRRPAPGRLWSQVAEISVGNHRVLLGSVLGDLFERRRGAVGRSDVEALSGSTRSSARTCTVSSSPTNTATVSMPRPLTSKRGLDPFRSADRRGIVSPSTHSSTSSRGVALDASHPDSTGTVRGIRYHVGLSCLGRDRRPASSSARSGRRGCARVPPSRLGVPAPGGVDDSLEKRFKVESRFCRRADVRAA